MRQQMNMSGTTIADLLSQKREFLDNKYVYAVISQRMGGLTIGVNMNPDKRCDYNCVYCEVDRSTKGGEARINIGVMIEELKEMLMCVQLGRISHLPAFQHAPADLIELRGIAISGNGEPTLCPNFLEVIEKIQELQRDQLLLPFHLVLITNGSGFKLPQVQQAIDRFEPEDHIWVKLDAGSQAYFEKINRSKMKLEAVLDNILEVSRRRPVIIQSLFLEYQGSVPDKAEIRHYTQRLASLVNRGAKISQVHIYSARRPVFDTGCGHLSLKSLMEIAREVRSETGLRVEVF